MMFDVEVAAKAMRSVLTIWKGQDASRVYIPRGSVCGAHCFPNSLLGTLSTGTCGSLWNLPLLAIDTIPLLLKMVDTRVPEKWRNSNGPVPREELPGQARFKYNLPVACFSPCFGTR